MNSDSQVPPSPSPGRSHPGQNSAQTQPVQPQKILDALPVVVWQADSQGSIISLSARWQTLTGYSPQLSLGEAFWDRLAEQEGASSRQQWHTFCQQQQPFTLYLNVVQTGGTFSRVLVMGEPLRDEQAQPMGWVGTMQSVDEGGPVPPELDYGQHFLAAVLDNLSNGIVACDSQGVLTLTNRATQEIHQKPFRQIPAEQWANYYNLYRSDGLTPLDRDENPLYQALLGESVQNAEVVIKPDQGPPHTVLASGDPIVAPDGQTLGAVVVLQDITERKQAEQELQESEQRWQLALEGAGDGIFDWNLMTNKAFLSLPWKQTLGYEEYEVENSFEGWRSLVHPDDLEDAAAALDAHFKHEEPLYQAEFRMRCKDGSYKWILARAQTQKDENGQPIRMLGLHQDITPQKLAEQKLAEMNRALESRVNTQDSQLAEANHQNEALAAQEQTARQQAKVAKAETQLYEKIVKNIQVGFLVWHSTDLTSIEAFELLVANPAAERLLDMELQDKIGDRIDAVFPEYVKNHPNNLLALLQVIRSQHPRTMGNASILLPTGATRVLCLRAFPLPDACVGIAFEPTADASD
ncbi:PAS domain S-box protein [Acaryochloris sp. CCMEE 5410]|uniref:PAS domain-containing protein n=1 Tax=Acaryochloris sp. CCMEE 5410 TaxID=310037 RepID=UPI0002484290|nr:PAS domain S-box protein [Acaryochloris sp. CCMEE 5410]KAI9132835.1 PAS domain S-box protein [Acaryochloris sp. CCMEE 5410]